MPMYSDAQQAVQFVGKPTYSAPWFVCLSACLSVRLFTCLSTRQFSFKLCLSYRPCSIVVAERVL